MLHHRQVVGLRWIDICICIRLSDFIFLLFRLGSRKWAPRFDYILEQLAYTALDAGAPVNPDLLEAFKTNSVHAAVDACCEMRPSVDISLFAESTMLERTMA